jgi:DNA-binding CsgD family transcriptional regulator
VNLTLAEIEVMLMVGRGKTDKQIAAELHKSPATVKQQIQSVREKLGAHTRAQALLLLYKNHK